MTSKLQHLFVFLISLCLASSAAAYGIGGAVICEGDGTPLAGITVTASKGGTAVSDTSGATGTYELSSLPEGEGTWDMSVDSAFPVTGPETVELTPLDAFATGVDYVIDDPSCASPFCGDGTLDPGEACDDGNNIDGDGCSAMCTVESFCGDGVLDPGEQCDDGNNINGDGCSAMCTVEGGGEGCTPGYWRQPHHFDSYSAPYTADTLFVHAFGVDAFPGETLSEVAAAKGGQLNALGRHAVAALLNAASADVSYDRTPDQVIASFQSAYASGDYEFLKNLFENFNEQGCPLN